MATDKTVVFGQTVQLVFTAQNSFGETVPIPAGTDVVFDSGASFGTVDQNTGVFTAGSSAGVAQMHAEGGGLVSNSVTIHVADPHSVATVLLLSV